MRRFPLLIAALFLAAACVGHPADDEDDPTPSQPDVTDPSGDDDPAADNTAPSLVLDFTATWCVNCPRMASAIEEVAQERPGKIVSVGVHYHDAMDCAEGLAMAQDYAVQAYPSLIVNLDPASLMTATSKDLLISRLDATTAGRKAPCAISIGGTLSQLTISVTAAEKGHYKLGVVLVEDGLVAAQTGGTEDYVHNAVLRKLVSASLSGDELGELEAGASAQKEYSVEVAASAAEGYRIIAFVTDSDQGGKVNTVKDEKMGE